MPTRHSVGRLARYGVSGACSALTHVGVLIGLVEVAHVWPVAASTAGFVVSIAVSYVLQHAWVFRSTERHTTAVARFLTVTAVAFGLNAGTLWLGTDVAELPYLVVQAAALVAIPVTNYLLNSTWTFRR